MKGLQVNLVAFPGERAAVARTRREGGRLSALTLKSLWPVPATAIREAAGEHARILVPELNLGQYRLELERLLPDRPVVGLHRVDGEMITPAQVLEASR